VKLKLNDFWNKIRGFVKAFGINGLIALIIWLSPSWLSFFIPSLKEFAVIWLGLVISPVVPSWLAVPLLAVIVALVRKGIVILIRWLKDQMIKLRWGSELFTLYSVDEIEIIMLKGRSMKKKKDKATSDFKEHLKQERIKLIKENWELSLEEVEQKQNIEKENQNGTNKK